MYSKKDNAIACERDSVPVDGSFFNLVKERLKKQKGFVDFKVLILIAVFILLVLIVFA